MLSSSTAAAGPSRVQLELLHELADSHAFLQVEKALRLLFEEAEHDRERSSRFFWRRWGRHDLEVFMQMLMLVMLLLENVCG